MIITAYILDEAIRRQTLLLDREVIRLNPIAARDLADKVAKLSGLARLYALVCRVNVKAPVGEAMTLGEAQDRLALLGRIVDGTEQGVREMPREALADSDELALTYTHVSEAHAAFAAAVAEGRANKLDTEAHEIVCEPDWFA